MSFSFRRLNSGDAATWQSLRLEGVRNFPLGFLVTEKEALGMNVARAQSVLSAGAMRGVFQDDKLIGFCGYRPEHLARTRHRAELGPFYVSSHFHGSGAADTLMNGVIHEARSAEIDRLELLVDTENFRAIRFYERHGFKKTATHFDGVRIDGQSRDDYFYHLHIAT